MHALVSGVPLDKYLDKGKGRNNRAKISEVEMTCKCNQGLDVQRKCAWMHCLAKAPLPPHEQVERKRKDAILNDHKEEQCILEIIRVCLV